MESNMKVTFDVLWNCAGPIKSGTVQVDEFKMDFVVHNGQLILSDPNANEVSMKFVSEALKALGVTVFEAKKI